MGRSGRCSIEVSNTLDRDRNTSHGFPHRSIDRQQPCCLRPRLSVMMPGRCRQSVCEKHNGARERRNMLTCVSGRWAMGDWEVPAHPSAETVIITERFPPFLEAASPTNRGLAGMAECWRLHAGDSRATSWLTTRFVRGVARRGRAARAARRSYTVRCCRTWCRKRFLPFAALRSEGPRPTPPGWRRRAREAEAGDRCSLPPSIANAHPPSPLPANPPTLQEARTVGSSSDRRMSWL